MLLPHAVPRKRLNNNTNGPNSGGLGRGISLTGHAGSISSIFGPCPGILMFLAISIPSLFVGSFFSLTMSGISSNCETTTSISGSANNNADNKRLQERIRILEEKQESEINRLVQIKVQQAVDKNCDTIRVLEDQAEHEEAAASSMSLFPPESVGRYAIAMARTSKQDFTDALDTGVPLDPPSAGSEDILLLYQRTAALPTSLMGDDNNHNTIQHIDMPEAVEHCEYLNVIFTDHAKTRNQCIAIMPQYESYHIQKWMRLDDKGKLSPNDPLRLVSRGVSPGKDVFRPPHFKTDTLKHWDMLRQYLASIDSVTDELRPILEKIAVDNTVIVMVCNFGQSQLLMNFVCAAKSRNLDISNIIVFTTDQETTDLAASLGLTAYYDERNFGDIPSAAARRYGDAKFTAMMMAKVICVQVVAMLGYDFLFQDVDIVWFKHPMEYFKDQNNPKVKGFDIFFQDDGGHSIRYAPYSANSGFYFVRHNERTLHFLTSLLMAGDLILRTESHQQALIALLNEHVSLFGLKAKVLARYEEEFPGGYQYHQKSKDYMTKYFKGIMKPYIFHMSWTLNKDNKLKFFRQMGEWYVDEKCIDHKVADIIGQPITDNTTISTTNIIPTCCSETPLFSCHYRDKPSIQPCKDSPPIDKGRKSWW